MHVYELSRAKIIYRAQATGNFPPCALGCDVLEYSSTVVCTRAIAQSINSIAQQEKEREREYCCCCCCCSCERSIDTPTGKKRRKKTLRLPDVVALQTKILPFSKQKHPKECNTRLAIPTVTSPVRPPLLGTTATIHKGFLSPSVFFVPTGVPPTKRKAALEARKLLQHLASVNDKLLWDRLIRPRGHTVQDHHSLRTMWPASDTTLGVESI